MRRARLRHGRLQERHGERGHRELNISHGRRVQAGCTANGLAGTVDA